MGGWEFNPYSAETKAHFLVNQGLHILPTKTETNKVPHLFHSYFLSAVAITRCFVESFYRNIESL